jgi:acetyl esterase/lipase
MEPVLTSHSYKVADQCEIRLNVYNAPDRTPRPGILWLHGGGLILGSRRMLPADQARRYIEAGFAVVAADYRLAPEEKVAAIVGDVLDAYRWTGERGDEIGVQAIFRARGQLSPTFIFSCRCPLPFRRAAPENYPAGI